jgi:uncharacterized membrane protein
MAEGTTKPRRRVLRREPEEESRPSPDEAEEAMAEAEPQAEPEAPAGEEPREGEDKEYSLFSELRTTVRDAALEVLKPVAAQATTSAAKYAVKKGPDLVKDKVAPKITEAGGAGAVAKGALSKGGGVAGGITQKAGGITQKLGRKKEGGKAATGTGRGRRLPVQEHVDVAVDLQTAYDQWTQFEDFPQFMHRVEKVEQRDDATLMWHENIWGVRRSWEAEITDQKPCERIAWRSKSGTQTVGVVTFHRLSDRLTRIQVNLDFQPKGLFEKTASGLRVSRRALRSDLMRFKAFIEMKDAPAGAWRGRIEEGEVVEPPGHEQGEEPEAAEEREEPEAEEEREEPEAEEERREPEAAEEREEPEAEEERKEPEAAEEPEEPEAEEEPEEPKAEEEPEEAEAEYVEEEEEQPEERPTRRRGATRTARTATRRRR